MEALPDCSGAIISWNTATTWVKRILNFQQKLKGMSFQPETVHIPLRRQFYYNGWQPNWRHRYPICLTLCGIQIHFLIFCLPWWFFYYKCFITQRNTSVTIFSLINHVFRHNILQYDYKPLLCTLLTRKSNGASDVNVIGILPSSAESQ